MRNFFFNLFFNLLVACFIIAFVYILGCILLGMAIAVTYFLLEMMREAGLYS